MARWFTPTAENYFSRIGTAHTLAALHEIKDSIAPAWNTAKKSELAAEREVAGTGWLLDILRSVTSRR